MPKKLTDIADLSEKRVLVRVPFNVPLDGETIRDTSRIDDALPTIEFLKNAGAQVILMSHMSDKEASLAPVAEYLRGKGLDVEFVGDFREQRAESVKQGSVVLLENIRRYSGEEANDVEFAKELAGLADIFVNDDFTSTHRMHASVVTLPTLLPSYMGIAFAREYDNLFAYIPVPQDSLAIVGGAKPETKLPLIAHLAKHFTHVYAGGVSANTVFEDRGEEIGRSLSASKEISELDAISADVRIGWPADLRVVDEAGETRVCGVQDVRSNELIVDAGPESIAELMGLVERARFVVWNGPFGDYEKGYTESTHAIARMLADSGTTVIVGGGDTIASIKSLNLESSFTFVSNAGGAMLHLFAHGSLPGVDVLESI